MMKKGNLCWWLQKKAISWSHRKRKVMIGELYGDQIEIKQGLKEGDQLITEGYQSLYDGQLITTTTA